MSVHQSSLDLGPGLSSVRELSEIATSVARADVITVWLLAVAVVGLLSLVL